MDPRSSGPCDLQASHSPKKRNEGRRGLRLTLPRPPQLQAAVPLFPKGRPTSWVLSRLMETRRGELGHRNESTGQGSKSRLAPLTVQRLGAQGQGASGVGAD